MNDRLNTVRHDLLEAFVDRLPNLDWDRIPQAQQSVETAAEMMISSIPTVYINSPLAGACYNACGLAFSRRVARQAIHQQHRASRILWFEHGRIAVYSTIRFSDTGRTFPVARYLLAQRLNPFTDAVAVAVRTPNTKHESR